jgi:hypothetical protein
MLLIWKHRLSESSLLKAWSTEPYDFPTNELLKVKHSFDCYRILGGAHKFMLITAIFLQLIINHLPYFFVDCECFGASVGIVIIHTYQREHFIIGRVMRGYV